ncbi:hypothetical protein T492DRAFT_1012138 [Pavlovales sp. CCMP2436]|nr:hypothetical protein T492DRAFT_1012138 [Pavlovales sp. CCMP2436]
MRLIVAAAAAATTAFAVLATLRLRAQAGPKAVGDCEGEAEAELEGGGERVVRIWMDGVFDLMHHGHVNAFRQGRAMGTYLVVGINDDASVAACKGCAPLMSEAERAETVGACRWVDEVVRSVPYVMDDAYLSHILDAHGIDYVVHGDDACIVDGRDVYEVAIRRGKYRTIPRTEGISTTDIVRRMLRAGPAASPVQDLGTHSHFFLTAGMLVDFAPTRCGRQGEALCAVYLDGCFDLFHAGHVAVLRAARALGDYLIVGVHDDATAGRICGPELPVMSLNERVMCVLGCRHVDEVVLAPPWSLSREMFAALNLAVVARARVDDELLEVARSLDARYEVAQALDMYAEVDAGEFAQLRGSGVIRRACEQHS